MTIQSGYSSSLPTDVLLGSMVIYIDGTAAYGATQGDPSVALPHEYENLEFDGKMIPMAGLDRRIGGVPTIEGTFIELNNTKALDLEPGGTTATATSVTTITPKLYGEFLTTATDYKQNVRAVCRRGGGGIVAVEFDYGLLIVDSIAGASKGNGTVKLKFEARQDPTAPSLGVAPYTIKLAADIQTIVTPDP